MRVLLTIGLIAPAVVMFIELRNDIDAREATASRELLGVEYLRALEPLASALGAAQTAAVSGGSAAVDSATDVLAERIADVDEVDQRVGGDLGVHERWTNLRGRIEALPRRGEPRSLYADYRDVMQLELAMVDRIGQLSRLTVDADADTYFLHRAVTSDLPQLIVATGRLADLASLNQVGPVDTLNLADLLQLRREAAVAADRLDESMEAAAAGTADNTLVNNVFGPLDAVRGDLDRLSTAGTSLTDGQVSAVDAEVIATLRENLAKAASTLSTSIYDQMTSLLTSRRDAAGRERVAAIIALSVIVALAVLLSLAATRDLLRYQAAVKAREREENAEPIGPGPQWSREPADVGRERAGAAR